MKKSLTSILGLLLITLFAVQANASVIVFDDIDSFEAAIQGIGVVYENFEDQALAPGLSIVSTSGSSVIAGGRYKDIVNADNGWTQTFSFDGLVYGFGAWLDLVHPGGQGTGIAVTLPELSTLVGEVPGTQAGQFWGFVSTVPFTQVVFSEGTGSGIQETYYSIDLVFSTPQAVPIPAAAWLLGSGLVGLVGLRRKFRA